MDSIKNKGNTASGKDGLTEITVAETDFVTKPEGGFEDSQYEREVTSPHSNKRQVNVINNLGEESNKCEAESPIKITFQNSNERQQ